MDHERVPGEESLTYQPSKVSWATAQFIRLPPLLAARLFLYILIIGLATAFTYAYYAQVPRSIEARGQLVTEQKLLPVRVPVTMTVAELNVAENDHVDRGDVLLKPRNELEKADYQQIKADHDRLEAFLSREESGRCRRECLDELEEFAQAAFVLGSNDSTAVAKTLSPVQEALRQFVIAKRDLQTAGLRTQGLRRQIRMADKKLAKIREMDAEEMLSAEVDQFESRKADARSKISEIRGRLSSKVEQRRSRLEVQAGGLMTKIEKYRTETTVTAPRAGTVTNLTVSGQGQLLSSGTKILSIIPENARLVGQLMVANRDISKVEPGMTTEIKLDALPEREFGTVRGTVEAVSENVAQRPAGGGESETAVAPAYPVRVTLQTQSIDKNGKSYPFRLGMTLEGVIVTEYESLLELGLRKLLNIKDDVLEG